MNNILNLLQGKKTYIAAAGLALTAVAKFLSDNDVADLVKSLWAAFAVFAVRNAISNK